MSLSLTDSEPEPSGCCKRCGTAVSKAFRKVFGDNENDAYGCRDCYSLKELCEGAAAKPDFGPSAIRGDSRAS